MLLVGCLASASPAVLDRIIFGNASSEAAHAVQSVNSQTGTTASGRSFRTVSNGGVLNFTIACSRTLIAEFNGDDTEPNGEMIAVVPEYFAGKVSDCSYPAELEMCLTDRLDHACIGTMLPNRSQIMSFDLGPLAKDCSSTPLLNLSIVPQGSTRTPAMYQIFTNSSQGSASMFDPDLSLVPPGSLPAPAGPRTHGNTMPHITSQPEFLDLQVAAGTEHMRNFQAFGPDWDAAVANGSAPAIMTGAVFRGGWSRLVHSSPGNASEWEREWADGSDGSNNNWFAGLEAFAASAVGQSASGSVMTAMEQDVTRVIAGLDFLRRAQGANGGFDGTPKGLLWLGGPNRKNASGCLEGYGHRGPAEAVLLLLGNKTTAPMFVEALQGTFDDDGNSSTPNVTRRIGYEALFSGSRDFLVTSRGHAPNQDIADILGAALSNRVLQGMHSSRAWTDEQMVPYA